MGLAKGRHVERWHAVESSEMGAQQCTTQSILIKLQSKVEIIFFLTNGIGAIRNPYAKCIQLTQDLIQKSVQYGL